MSDALKPFATNILIIYKSIDLCYKSKDVLERTKNF